MFARSVRDVALVLLIVIVAASIKTSCLADELDRPRLIAAARAGGDYLVRIQRPDGSFHYSYNAREDRFDSQAYNILRHAGVALSLLELYAATRDIRYLDSARRAIEFLKTRFRPARDKSSLYVLDFDGKAKLGANGLALYVLARQLELDARNGDRKSAARLASHIRMMQHKDGSFASYYRLRGHEPQGSVSLYYPGEAILGLVELFKMTGDRRLIDSARRGADHLIESQKRMDELPPDAWLMQGLEALHKIGREQRYADHAIDLAEAMIAHQYAAGAPDGYEGGFGPGRPRATPAASRAEGMLAAYRLARVTGDARASVIAAALKASARFQLSHQLEAGSSLANPKRAAGGFRGSARSWRVRIDSVQHNISSLLGITKTLY
jgi:uncharacterized protein YyaL (SSP411 family)